MRRLLLFLFLCLVSAPGLWGDPPRSTPNELNEKDLFQAEQWLRLARSGWTVGDYSMVRYFSRLIVEHYPDSYYSREAKDLLDNSSSPALNNARDRIRNNPGLFLK